MAKSGRRGSAGAGNEKAQERRHELNLLVVSNILVIGRWIAIFGGITAVGYVFVALPLKFTAGKETSVNFIYQAVLGMGLRLWIPYGVAVLFAGLWQRERHMRKQYMQRNHERTMKLEGEIDPKRTTSGLTARGETPKESL